MVKDGYWYGLPLVLIAGGLMGSWLHQQSLFLLVAAIFFAILSVFVLNFFRDPDRLVPAEANAIVSPADGLVVQLAEEEFDGRVVRRLSIFMSPLDVHVNRTPIAGNIRNITYKKGSFRVASKSVASAENEQNVFTIEGEQGVVVVKQIAGLLARRIVFWKRLGDSLARGERVGMIKFGSRVDVLVAPTVEWRVKVGDRVRAGSSILGTTTPKPIERRGLRRGIYVIPSLFTVGTLVCGYYAVLSTQRAGQLLAAAAAATVVSRAAELSLLATTALDAASKAIGWAIVFDGLDGRIARLTNTASPFGRELDSLADVITFGVAPALLAYVWGVRGLSEMAGGQQFQNLRELAGVLTFAYVICGAARLARFNIETVKPSADRRFFVGMPIPAAAGFVAAIIHFYKQPITTWQFSLIWLLAVGIIGYLMVSRMRYWSFKTLNLRKRRSYLAIIVIALAMGAIWLYSEPVLLFIGIAYAISGIVLRIISKIRPRPPAPQEVHAA